MCCATRPASALIPLLIFDQFEELFTLAQSDEFGRNRAAGFIGELADLVENRAPRSLEAKFEEDESAAARFDFARSDYRVLIALREDYLAPLESLKAAMPSVSQNRLRLAPMNGEQALAAVLGPGKGLVSEEVAEAIVRFVAGGAELANAEVEPSLLSLICRELNDARLEQGRREISLDLLAGSHSSILSNFYERALADQPPGVRRVIEDDLLTSSGFRENVAEERLLSRLNEAGAAPGTLALLVNRRLLRIEERLDLRRVELTHDVLCQVVKASRDARQEREARDAAERRLAEQHARELAARRALVRARQVAAVCTVLALLAIAAAVLAYFSERHAQQTQAVAEQARSQSERLLAYLADDFARELEVTGRLDALADFSKRQIDYFHALPAALKSPDSIRNAALALTHHGRALRTLGDLDQGGRDASRGNPAARGPAPRRGHLGSHHAGPGRRLPGARADPGQPQRPAVPAAGRACTGPAAAPGRGPGRLARGAPRLRLDPHAPGLHAAEGARVRCRRCAPRIEAREIAAALGARDLTDLDMGAYYAEATAWLVTALFSTGQQAVGAHAGRGQLCPVHPRARAPPGASRGAARPGDPRQLPCRGSPWRTWIRSCSAQLERAQRGDLADHAGPGSGQRRDAQQPGRQRRQCRQRLLAGGAPAARRCVYNTKASEADGAGGRTREQRGLPRDPPAVHRFSGPQPDHDGRYPGHGRHARQDPGDRSAAAQESARPAASAP